MRFYNLLKRGKRNSQEQPDFVLYKRNRNVEQSRMDEAQSRMDEAQSSLILSYINITEM
jgi:hypothetical protein